MNITVNGKETVFEKESVEDVLSLYNLKSDQIAVELNGTIVHREEFASTGINEGDVIEIVRFVGGG